MAKHLSAMYVLTQMVDDWAGEGPAMIHWAARRQGELQGPWEIPSIVAGEEELSREERQNVENAAKRFFTPAEVEDLGSLLVQQFSSEKQSMRYGRVDLPTSAEVVVAMQESNPFGARRLWRIRPPDPILAGHPVPCEGIVSLWPWPRLDPEDIVRLIAMRESMGKDVLPSAPSPAGK